MGYIGDIKNTVKLRVNQKHHAETNKKDSLKCWRRCKPGNIRISALNQLETE